MTSLEPGRGARSAALGGLAVAVIWGVNVPVMKAALADLHPFAFNALRLSLSVAVLGAAEAIGAAGATGATGATGAAGAIRGPGGAPASARAKTPWRDVLIFAVLTSLGYQALFISGIARTSAGHTGFLIASGPMWTALIAGALGVERVPRRAWFGLVVAFVGTSLVVAAARGGEATLLGNLLVLAAMVSWALGTVRSRAVLLRMSSIRLAFLAGLVSLPGHWLVAAPHLGSMRALAGEHGARLLACVAYSGALSTGLAYVLWNRSVAGIGPARTAAFTNLVPLVAAAVAWAMLGERPGPLQLVGGALVLVGIASWRARRPR